MRLRLRLVSPLAMEEVLPAGGAVAHESEGSGFQASVCVFVCLCVCVCVSVFIPRPRWPRLDPETILASGFRNPNGATAAVPATDPS